MPNRNDEIVGNNTATKTGIDDNESVSNEEYSSSENESTSSAELDNKDDIYEDGYDILTHGGGGLEVVEGFENFETMVTGIGSAESVALPNNYETLACAGTIEYEVPETVCGYDDRTKIKAIGNVPWRMICQLIITLGDGRHVRGTGWFISPRTIMTAGHCVHSHNGGGWAKNIEIIPGMDGLKRPFGSVESRTFKSVKGWVDKKKTSHDYGCIMLPKSTPLGDKTGWFGFANLSDATLENLLANNSGYPGDKSFGTQWYNAGRISSMTDKRLHYMLDTAPGQSGSPTWRFSSTSRKRHAVGIHNYGGCENKSTRINDAVFTNMKTWKNQGFN